MRACVRACVRRPQQLITYVSVLAIQSTGKDGGFPDDLRKEANSSFSGNSYAIDVDSNSPPVSTWHVYLASLSTLWSSSSNLGKEGPTKEGECTV